MPFDTTYHIYSADKNASITQTNSGGEDIDIFLGPGEMPPVQYSYSVIDSLLNLPPQNYTLQQDGYTPGPVFILIFLSIIVFIAYKARGEAEHFKDGPSESFASDIDEVETARKKKACLTYYGDELGLSNEQYNDILNKHFPYYTALDINDKSIFLYRLNRFIKDKTFKIHDESAYREMPVLISAAAIQLTFGLKKYLLPNFQFIHVFPQEFMRTEPILCFLEGNVSGHSINLSWKHFLAGLQDITDGKNVGLHEMAHALYYQTFVMEENVDVNFRDGFNHFNHDGNKAYDMEMVNEVGLYSEYAMTNFQEFWAESVELFFEKPKELYKCYPNLYVAIADLLNQRPVNFA